MIMIDIDHRTCVDLVSSTVALFMENNLSHIQEALPSDIELATFKPLEVSVRFTY